VSGGWLHAAGAGGQYAPRVALDAPAGGPSTSPLDAMKRALKLALLLLLAACGQRVIDAPASLLGRWTLAAPVLGCPSASVEFTADNHLKMISGAQTLEAAIETRRKNDGYLISLQLLRINDEPNCQGISADYVAEHFAPFIFVRVSEGTLTYLTLDKNLGRHGPPLEFKRVGVGV
jgi:hypothetical protein